MKTDQCLAKSSVFDLKNLVKLLDACNSLPLKVYYAVAAATSISLKLIVAFVSTRSFVSLGSRICDRVTELPRLECRGQLL